MVFLIHLINYSNNILNKKTDPGYVVIIFISYKRSH